MTSPKGMLLAELEAAGGDVDSLQALAQGDAAALTEALKALGFTKLGKRVEIKKALLAAAPSPAQAPVPLEQRPAAERASVAGATYL